MGATIERRFATRRQAELVIERLVQEHGFERTDIFVSPAGDDNSVGEIAGGGDAATPNEAGRSDGPVISSILVSIDLEDDDRAPKVEAVFDEFEGR